MGLTTTRYLFTVLTQCTAFGCAVFGLGLSAVFCTLFSLNTAIAQTKQPNDTEQPGPQHSILTLSAQLGKDELTSWLSESIPEQFLGQGSEKVCKRLLGLKLCGTALWNYQVDRTADIRWVNAQQTLPGITLQAPLSVNGLVGVDGDVAQALGIHSVPVSACLLYTSPSPRDKRQSRMPSSA